MELIWIRHLQTPGNEKRQYIGSTDEPLSEKTVEGFLKNPAEYSEVERVICSPMLRCIQTAELMFPGTERKTEPRLRECDFGQFEGKTYDECCNDTWFISGIYGNDSCVLHIKGYRFVRGKYDKSGIGACVFGFGWYSVLYCQRLL